MQAAKRVYLIGFMGVGKTYWGSVWAKQTGWDFFDLDEEIALAQGKPVQEIFTEKGESFFREVESDVLRSTAFLNRSIVACGGGTSCFFNNLEWMKKHGIVVWLQAGVDTILRNIASDKTVRPLLQQKTGDALREHILKLQQNRSSCYEAADIKLLVEDAEPNDIFALLNNHHA